MTTVIKNASAAELLGALPALVGSMPHNSVVLIGFRGKRTHAALRYDIPSAGIKRFAATAIGTFCRIPEVDGVVVVICTDAPYNSHGALLEVLLRRLEQAGFPVKDAFVVAAEGWGSHFDPDVPPGGRALAEIKMLESDEPVPLQVPRSDDLACMRMASQVESLFDAEPEELHALDDLPHFADRALERNDPSPLLLFALQRPFVRDLVMLQWAFGLDLGDAIWSGDTCFGIEARKTWPDADERAADLMLGHGPQPDVERLKTATELLTTLIPQPSQGPLPGL